MSTGSRLVVVGGGSGFVGSALTKTLKANGYESIIISRQKRENSMTWNDLVQNGLPKGTSAVINVAGQNVLDPTRFWTNGFKQNVFASRVNTTRYLAEAIAKSESKPKVFVTISGVGFYPPSETEVYDENSSGGNFDFLSRLCTQWEKATELSSKEKVRTAVIRSGVVIGSGGGMIQQLSWPFYLGLGGPIGNGRQPMPWIHIDDLSRLFLHCIEQESAEGVFNGVAPQMISNKEFATSFASALNRPAFIPLPTFAVDLLFSRERAKIMTEGQKVVPRKAQHSNFTFQYPTIDEACSQVVSK